jgi:Mrp family chromosome partitioning ATPase
VTDPAAEQAQVAALIARISVLTNYLAEAQAEIASVNEAEGGITELQRRKEITEASYRYFSAGLEQTRIDAALGSTDTSSVSVVEEASLAGRDLKPTLKAVLIALCAGLGGGIGLALLLEFGLSQTIKRPIDIEQKLRLPLFLSIPDFGRNGYAERWLKQIGLSSPAAPAEDRAQPGDEVPQAVAVRSNPLDAYYEALRDRLIMYFQIKEMTHKPKLVGLTSLVRGAGISQLASGLAKTLSETGEGKVLLVDMHVEKGLAVHPFYQGRAMCHLADAFEDEKRTPALVQDNLYVAAVSGDTGNKVGIVPRKFLSLVPKMKASDYDYIIFDLPPVGQTSVTSKIAGLLDITLLVLESERTSLEQAKRGATLLTESRANLGAVLNHYHDYLPAKLSIDL